VRKTVFRFFAPLLFVLASPALMLAQFQQPTADELKMTADPQAPGAAAVYLNVEEDTNDPLHFQTFYARIKVLTEKGKELATVDLPYLRNDSSVTDIKGRTIHADGTVIPLTGKPADLLVSKKASKEGDLQVNRKYFTLPSVEVGSILEYSYQIQRSNNEVRPPTWEIQRPYFVHKAHYFFTPCRRPLPVSQHHNLSYILDDHSRNGDDIVWLEKLPPGASVITVLGGRYSVDVTDVPPAPDEGWMPPIQSVLYKVIFYYLEASGPGYYMFVNSPSWFWVNEAKLWSKDVDRFADPSKRIHDAVDGLIAPSDSDLDKARKLYHAVQALDNTDYSRQKSATEMKKLKLTAAKRAEDTWEQKSGSREDIARLYLAMLRAAGLTAYAMKVVDRSQGLFDSTYLTFDQLDDTIVILSTGGKEIYLDPGEKMCPFQMLSWRHSDAGGIRQVATNRAIDTTPPQPYPENKTSRIGDVTVDAHGAITASFSVVMIGQEALRWRQAALRNDQDEVKRQFDSWLESMIPEGVEAHIDSFTGLDDPDVSLIASVKAQGSLGAATSKRLLLPGFFFETRSVHPFVAEDKRQQPVDIHYRDVLSDQITYRLPDGFSVEAAPQDAKMTWPDHAIFVNKTVPAPGHITVARILVRSFTFAKIEEYQDLRAFYQKVAAADQQQLVLTAAPAPKGNQ
jgi:Domain of Unknown Function with PDB structure (DUF3857)/Transglutaminase-like superfamily